MYRPLYDFLGSSNANNHPAVVQTDCSQLWCSDVEEHEAVYLIRKKPTPPIVEDEEGRYNSYFSVSCCDGLGSNQFSDLQQVTSLRQSRREMHQRRVSNI